MDNIKRELEEIIKERDELKQTITELREINMELQRKAGLK